MPIFKKIFKAFKQKITGKKKSSPQRKKTKKISPPKKRLTARERLKATQKKKNPLGSPAGEVTHYFSGIQVGVVKIKSGRIRLLDKFRIKGHTTDFVQTVKSLQIDHEPVPAAAKGKSVGLKVDKKVRAGDKVYRKGQATFDYIIMVCAVIVVLLVFLNPGGLARRTIEKILNGTANQFNAMVNSMNFN